LLGAKSLKNIKTKRGKETPDPLSLKTKQMKIKAINIRSPRTGNGVANQFEITFEHDNFKTIFFQSYNSVIAKLHLNTKGDWAVYLDSKDWDYSRTTLKYLRVFLNDYINFDGYTKDIRDNIESGLYKLTNLN
tara:strand:- start:534 stop:932 length:399 start_codon:yes stop_codon:yes gene_type:complete